MRSVITGTGHYVPERVVTNEELVPVIGGTALWVTERTGILERRYAAAAQTTSELGEHAARRALEDAGIAPEDLDAVVFATLSPDVMFPGCGVFLTARLGLTATPALDVRNQCSGYLYALSVADAWIRAGVYARVLIVGAEIHSTGMRFDHEGRSLTALFGDGAGAVVLEGTEDDTRGVVEVRLGADGSGAEHLWCEAPGSRGGEHVTWEDLHAGRHFPTMNGRAVFRNAVSTLTREINALLQDHALPERERAELVVVPHQANQRINELVAQQLGLTQDRVVHTIARFGNTTAASIPMALDVARRDGRVTHGTLIVHAAFGSGYTWGTALLRL